MIYPKSQIKSNLNTKGGELIYSNTKKEYKGPYHIISGKYYFSQPTPNSYNIERLTLISKNNNPYKENESEIKIKDIDSYSYNIVDYPYYRAKKLPLDKPAPLPPKSYYPSLKNEDYIKGEIDRYFLKKINKYEFLEVNREEYIKYINQDPKVLYTLYFPFTFKWIIKGDLEKVINNNYNILKLTEKKYNIIGLTHLFKNKLSEFIKTNN